ncbi:RDD family protein [Vibrio aquimaris]|uniref:RDD family protein n=1 Tax=Vibrio aquimaris TaxID=2587862 RepID=A0A5P9CKF3_9VIBR|nr:RDD family protein [Vibrio aquimaris]QFT26724.1 RDD family protein [Vibrio aquimaris]
MTVAEKFRRTGAFVVDILIAKMFAQVLLSGLMFFMHQVLSGTDISLSLNDDKALPLMLGLIILAMITFIGVYVAYCLICFKLLGLTLGKYLLSVKEVYSQVSLRAYSRKELIKITLTVASLGVYPVYAGLQFYLFNKTPYHELT